MPCAQVTATVEQIAQCDNIASYALRQIEEVSTREQRRVKIKNRRNGIHTTNALHKLSFG